MHHEITPTLAFFQERSLAPMQLHVYTRLKITSSVRMRQLKLLVRMRQLKLIYWPDLSVTYGAETHAVVTQSSPSSCALKTAGLVFVPQLLMSQCHHHVFNALQREISKIPFEALRPILLERGVIPPTLDRQCNTKDGMKIVVGYIRNQDFETFLKFVECICIARDANASVEKHILDSIFSVVQDFDARNFTRHSVQVEKIMQRFQKKRVTFLSGEYVFFYFKIYVHVYTCIWVKKKSMDRGHAWDSAKWEGLWYELVIISYISSICPHLQCNVLSRVYCNKIKTSILHNLEGTIEYN